MKKIINPKKLVASHFSIFRLPLRSIRLVHNYCTFLSANPKSKTRNNYELSYYQVLINRLIKKFLFVCKHTHNCHRNLGVVFENKEERNQLEFPFSPFQYVERVDTMKVSMHFLYSNLFVGNIERYVAKQPTNYGYLTLAINIFYSVRFLMFCYHSYYPDFGWPDPLFGLVFPNNKAVSLVSMLALFPLFIMVTNHQYIYFKASFTLDMFNILYQLININLRDFYYSNQISLSSVQAQFSLTNWIHEPVHSLWSLLKLLAQLYNRGVLNQSRVHFRTRLSHFPVTFHLVRAKCVVLWLCCEVAYAGLMAAYFFTMLLIMFRSRNFIYQQGLWFLLELILSFLYAFFCSKCLGFLVFSLFVIYTTSTFTFMQINGNLAKYSWRVAVAPHQVVCTYRQHLGMVSFMLRQNKSASLLLTTFFYTTIPINIFWLVCFLLQRWSTLSEMFIFGPMLVGHFMVFLLTIFQYSVNTYQLHRGHRYFVGLQLQPACRRLTLLFKLKLMSYYERINTPTPIAVRIHGFGNVTTSEFGGFLLLYVVYILFTIELLSH